MCVERRGVAVGALGKAKDWSVASRSCAKVSSSDGSDSSVAEDSWLLNVGRNGQ